MTAAQRQHRLAVFFALGLVYFFWGSTYLGIRIAVENIPPALMCATRFLVAGALMLTYGVATGRSIRYSPRQLGHIAVLAALLLASIALWFLILDALILGDHHISVRGMIGLVLGVAGLVVLLWPELT